MRSSHVEWNCRVSVLSGNIVEIVSKDIEEYAEAIFAAIYPYWDSSMLHQILEVTLFQIQTQI